MVLIYCPKKQSIVEIMLHFSADVRGKKEMEFLELNQGNMIVADYVAKFEELSRFCPHYNGADAKMFKCIKFENGLRLEIKKYCIYDEASRVRSSHYKSVSDKRNGNLNHRKMYGASYVKGKQRIFDEKDPSGDELIIWRGVINMVSLGIVSLSAKVRLRTASSAGNQGIELQIAWVMLSLTKTVESKVTLVPIVRSLRRTNQEESYLHCLILGLLVHTG